ncbi:phage tail tube protein [Mesorhizobium marinum]|uniref:phage tail tube protein n=1 Tax=Mesorhizobium marinum TaxID=3228790 RepID=UPI00346670CB
MTDAAIGYGSVFEVSTNGGSSWTEIAEVFSITPPSDTVDVIDATHMASPNRTREFVLGLQDPGEASFEMNFVPGSASDAYIQARKAAPAFATITPGTLPAWLKAVSKPTATPTPIRPQRASPETSGTL